MKPGQVLTRWWQEYVGGRLRTPQDLFRSAKRENPDPAQAYLRFLDDPEDGPTWAAPQRLKAPGFILTDAALRQYSRADWQHCDPRLMRWAAAFVELARKRGVPLYVHSAFRTREQQVKAVRDGASKAPWPRSAHCIGEAVDIVHGVYHWQLTPQEWQFLGVLGRLALDRVNAPLKKADKLSLTWGGNDGPGDRFSWDPAHWEIADYRRRIREIEAGPVVHLTPRAILARYR